MKRNVVLVGLLGAVLALGPLPTAGQQPQSGRARAPLTEQQRQELERRVRQQFDRRMREELGLSQDESTRFQGLVRDFRDRRLELGLARRQLQVRMRREGRRSDLSDSDARQLLAESLALADQEAALLREEQEALLTILSPAQLVRLYEWRESLTQRLRRLRGVDPGQSRSPGGSLPEFPSPW